MKFSEEVISSRQNRTVVELCKLTDRKARQNGRIFRFDGIKLLEEAVAKSLEIVTVFLRESDAGKIVFGLQNRLQNLEFDKIGKILVVADDVFDRVSEEKSPEGVITIAKYIDKFQKNVTIYNSADFLEIQNERIVLLESVRDPSNIGAVIRSAAAFGVDRLILSEDCADIYHPRAVRASMGTLFDQRIDRVQNLPATISQLREHGRRVFAAALDARAARLGDFTPTVGDCVVIGNEGHGLSVQTIDACTGCVMIPMSQRAESLNAAVAASVLMWEFAK